MREIGGPRASRQPQALEQVDHLRVAGRRLARAQQPVPSEVTDFTEEEVLCRRQLRKERRRLEFPRDPKTSAAIWRQTGDRLVEVVDVARGGCLYIRHEVEERALAGTVGTNDAVGGPVPHREIEVVNRGQTTEALGQVHNPQHGRVDRSRHDRMARVTAAIAPIAPRGQARTTTISRIPTISNQSETNEPLRAVSSSLNPIAPTNPPMRVPRPPRTIQTITYVLKVNPKRSGETKPTGT